MSELLKMVQFLGPSCSSLQPIFKFSCRPIYVHSLSISGYLLVSCDVLFWPVRSVSCRQRWSVSAASSRLPSPGLSRGGRCEDQRWRWLHAVSSAAHTAPHHLSAVMMMMMIRRQHESLSVWSVEPTACCLRNLHTYITRYTCHAKITFLLTREAPYQNVYLGQSHSPKRRSRLKI